jgi:hypothetical protein
MTIDTICQMTTNPTLLNALHACRPDHPWNKTTKEPFANALFVAKQVAFKDRLSGEAEEWLRVQASFERNCT